MTPPPAAAARLDSAPIPLPEKKSAARKAPARADRPFKGIALVLASTIFLGASDVTAKYLSATLPSIEIAWIRFLVFALIMTPAMMPGSPLFALQTNRLGLHLMRGAALLGSSLFFISGLRFLPIAEASATGFVAPLFVTALSIIFLGEKVGMRRWIATGSRPDRRAHHPASGHRRVSPGGVLSAGLGAGLGLHADHDADDERHRARHHHHDLFVDRGRLLILSALVPFVWVTPTWHDIAFGIFIGVASTAGQWIVVLAFRYADASVLAPFSYTQLLWVSVLGFLIFGEVPDVYTVTGAAFIVASGLYTAHRERVRRSQLLAVPGEPSPNA